MQAPHAAAEFVGKRPEEGEKPSGGRRPVKETGRLHHNHPLLPTITFSHFQAGHDYNAVRLKSLASVSPPWHGGGEVEERRHGCRRERDGFDDVFEMRSDMAAWKAVVCPVPSL